MIIIQSLTTNIEYIIKEKNKKNKNSNELRTQAWQHVTIHL